MVIEDFVTTKEAAKLRGVDDDTVARWCRLGWLKTAHKIHSRLWLVDKDEVLSFEPPRPGPKAKMQENLDG